MEKFPVSLEPEEIHVDGVLAEELDQVQSSRSKRLEPAEGKHEARGSLTGLAFSGGGIRSATFNLGVLQGLAQLGMLRKFDYLSTVSGGGYIGGWLMAWMHHQKISIGEVEKRLSPEKYKFDVGEPSEVRFLRNYSNYLTPRKGLLSGDFWAFVASYLRNALLNITILLLLLLGLLLLPRAIAYLPQSLDHLDDFGYGLVWLTGKTPGEHGFAQYWALVGGMLFGLIGVVSMGLNLCWVNPPKDSKICWIAKAWAIHAFVVVPLLTAASLFSYGLAQLFRNDMPLDGLVWRVILIGLGMYFSLWIIACVARWVARRAVWPGCDTGPASWVILLTAFVTGGLCGLLFLPYARIVNGLASDSSLTDVWNVVTFGAPAMAGIMLLAGALHIGLMGRQFRDPYREWWARLGGYLALYAVCWLLLFVIVAYVPRWLSDFAKHHYQVTASSVFLWAASTAYGVLFGKSPLTSLPRPDSPLKKKIAGWVARATPYIFIFGLLAGLSVLAAWVAFALRSVKATPFDLARAGDYESPTGAFVWVVFAAAALILSWRVDINAFSTHLLYRNRLVRCYLGASVENRQSQPFTGFSAEDDLPLSILHIPPTDADPALAARPIPLLNTSLNVTRGKELSLQTRKARSFVFTPLYSGYTRPVQGSSEWQSAFAKTGLAGVKKPGTEHGITLGTAVAISGAAASPNMGSYSSPALAVLMTLFDVRLGWWLGNPRKKKWTKGSPDLGFWCLLRELFGAASDDSEYVYLSDGGHFENLAFYELVRRRCKLIVACDASCDPEHTFHDLHNAIERCRTDFGVEITRETHQLVLQGSRVSGHFDVCKIHYTPNEGRDTGILLYLKPGLKEDDPEDLLGYSRINHAFPHDSTADQWFDENQFENYRNLGYVTALSAKTDLSKAINDLLG